MDSYNNRLIQRHLGGNLFELRYKGRFFLFNPYPVRIFEIEQLVQDDQLNENIITMLRGDDKTAVYTPASFSGFGAVEFVATTRCNLRCRHCTARDFDQNGDVTYYGLAPSDMSVNMMIAAVNAGIEQLEARLLKDPVEVPNFEMFITGGEPMLVWDNLKVALTYTRKRLSEIPYVEECVFTPHIVTNGTLITESVAKEMVEYKVQVTIALDSPYNQVRIDQVGNAATPSAMIGLSNLIAVGWH